MSCVMVEYNLWKPGVGNQNLTLVVRDYLDMFREIMRDPRWKDQFDLAACNFRALSDWTTVFRLELGTHTAIVGNGCPIPNCISTAGVKMLDTSDDDDESDHRKTTYARAHAHTTHLRSYSAA